MSSFNVNATPQQLQLRSTSQLGSDATFAQPTNASTNIGSTELNQQTESNSRNHSLSQPGNEFNLTQAVDQLNQTLMQSNLKVEVAQKEPTNQVWLNVVDKTTGQVIQRIPPEGLRQSVETQLGKGLSINQKS